jgi:protein SCO1
MSARNLMNLRRVLAGAPRRTRWAIAVTAVLLAAAASAAWLSVPPAQQPRYVEVARGIYTLPKPDVLADFQLVKHDNTSFGNGALKGRWSFVIFGYTFCPDFCPTTLVVFNEMHALLAQRADGVRDVQFVMFSVDPERDTPKLLGNYVPQFNAEFIGVTGDAAMIGRLADSVGAVYAKVPGSSDSNYMVDHSTTVLLVNPQGRLQGVFAMPHVAKDMVQGFLKIREHAGAAPTAEWRAGPKPLSVAVR